MNVTFPRRRETAFHSFPRRREKPKQTAFPAPGTQLSSPRRRSGKPTNISIIHIKFLRTSLPRRQGTAIPGAGEGQESALGNKRLFDTSLLHTKSNRRRPASLSPAPGNSFPGPGHSFPRHRENLHIFLRWWNECYLYYKLVFFGF